MKISITEYGLGDALDDIEEYLVNATDRKNKKSKNDYINKAYGAVVAINHLIKVEKEYETECER